MTTPAWHRDSADDVLRTLQSAGSGLVFTLQGVKGTSPVLIAVSAVFALQSLFTYALFMGTFFHTRPLPFAVGLQIVAVGFALLVLLELEKLIRRRLLPAA
jgi:hypothetical protein